VKIQGAAQNGKIHYMLARERSGILMERARNISREENGRLPQEMINPGGVPFVSPFRSPAADVISIPTRGLPIPVSS